METNLSKDREILRELAKTYMDCFAQSDYEQRLLLHKGVNDLNPIRPVVLIEELPWHELDFDGSLTLRCQDSYLKEVENNLRQTIYKWRYMPADMLIPPYMPVYKVISGTGIGLHVEEDILSKQDGNHIVSHEYHDILAEESSLAKLHNNIITYDEKETLRQFNLVNEMIGDILPARITGHGGYYAIWDDIARYRGVEALLVDLADRPEYTHKIMEALTAIEMNVIDQYEQLNLFEPYPLSVHCTAAATDSLPPKGYDKDHVKASDTWGRGMAQIFSHVSPAMHEEFDVNYTGKILNRFGLSYYGCCEPLHNKIDILKSITNLRKVSITPWADVDIAADVIGKRYVLASKPNPAFVAEDGFDRERVRNEITKVLTACKRNNTTCEFVIKDISHCPNPKNLMEWERVAMETVRNFV